MRVGRRKANNSPGARSGVLVLGAAHDGSGCAAGEGRSAGDAGGGLRPQVGGVETRALATIMLVATVGCTSRQSLPVFGPSC